MSTIPLPSDPSLEQLRTQAKELRDQVRAGDPAATQLVARFHPRGNEALTLSGAQLVLARQHGFSSWAELKQLLDVIDHYRRAPDEAAGGHTTSGGEHTADEFLQLACLRYGHDDSPSRWSEARRILAEHPDIATTSIHVAAAVCDAGAVGALVRADPGLARQQGGPWQWEPLLYLAYARHDPAISEQAVVNTARLLLDHGADPNAGYLWHGLTSPFTALTGAFGHGELDPSHQPPHPHGLALASVLLEAGADPNDPQTLYNRQFDPDDGPIALLLEHGLGRGDGGPWRARLGHTIDTPAGQVSALLWWAVVHNQRARVRLLCDHGVDGDAPFPARGMRPFAGRRPVEVAAMNGDTALVEDLVARGYPPPRLEGTDALIAAALRNDRNEALARREYAAGARSERPGLAVWAVSSGKGDALALLVELGFDVNAFARNDIPLEQPWETALHCAVWVGDLAAIRQLLALGADPNLRDQRFHSTPLGWARHFGQTAAIELLAPVTADSEA